MSTYNLGMHPSRTLLACAAWSALLLAPAAAEDQMIDVKPCDFFCKAWRNLSGKAQVSSPEPIDNAARDSGPMPSAVDGAEAPQPSRVVAQRGVVIVQSKAEREAIRRRKLALERETTQHIQDGQAVIDRLMVDPSKKTVAK